MNERWVSGAILVLMAGPLMAEDVYRCERDGKVTYTDRPCTPEAQPHALPEAIVVQPPTKSERDLALQHDARLQREKSARDKADAKWVKDYKARQDRQERVRAAIIQHEVIKGMSAGEVRQSLGDPDRVLQSESHGSPKETWTYLVDGATRTVNFKNGEVSSSSLRKKPTK